MVKNVQARGTARRNTVLGAGQTAITRTQASIPARVLARDWLALGDTVLDWGCGKGKDVEYLRSLGYVCFGYDPVYMPYPYPFFSRITYSWVLCAYVLNVIPHPDRGFCADALFNILPVGGHAMVAVRASKELNRQIKNTWTAKYDGWITSAGTFQKGFDVQELVDFLGFYGFRSFDKINHDPVIVVAHK